MIWQSAWAWIGLAAIALPVLIHLLGRGHARVQPFPTLRFLQPSRLLPTRRTRLHDLLLLVVRAGILVSAVAALAQPLILTAHRTRALDAPIARAIIVDTSASMMRATVSGERAVDAARREAARLGAAAQNNIIIETTTPDRAIGGALAWLGKQAARGEVVVVSDFQLGAIDSTNLAAIPHASGVRLSKIAVSASTAATEAVARVSGRETVARITPTDDRTDVTWGAQPDSASSNAIVTVFADPREQAHANAALSAAGVLGVPLPIDTAHARRVAIVEPQFERGANWLGRGVRPTEAWMLGVVAKIRSNASLQVAVSNVSPIDADTARVIIAMRNEAGRPVVVATQDGTSSDRRLLLVSSADAGSLASALLIAEAQRALSMAPPLSELEPSVISDRVLATLQRPPATTTEQPARTNGGLSDGRWLWAVALLLLGVETWMRRPLAETAVESRAHDRAA